MTLKLWHLPHAKPHSISQFYSQRAEQPTPVNCHIRVTTRFLLPFEPGVSIQWRPTAGFVMPYPFQSILGIKFYIGELPGLLDLCAAGNFIVVPAAPALVDLTTDIDYRNALEKSDLAITDSGYMVVLWKFLTGQSLPRISGLKLLRGLLEGEELKRPGRSFWIMPSAREAAVNLRWLQRHGYSVTGKHCYVAPMYPKGAILDPDLLKLIEAQRPSYVMVNIGGGTQEPLGLYLKQNLSYRPSIICVGAAIGFLTGMQAAIPVWADTFMLGWVFRCLHAPKRFTPRIWKGLRLLTILAKYRGRSVAG
jgi:UDP-N-acetyl-D-mannosaminuronic acid transferase (WecB/TagA/CpsF family)